MNIRVALIFDFRIFFAASWRIVPIATKIICEKVQPDRIRGKGAPAPSNIENIVKCDRVAFIFDF